MYKTNPQSDPPNETKIANPHRQVAILFDSIDDFSMWMDNQLADVLEQNEQFVTHHSRLSFFAR